VLANAAEAGMNDILVPCASCYNRLAMTLHALQDEAVRTDMEVLLEKPLDPSIRVINIIQFVQTYIQPHLLPKLDQQESQHQPQNQPQVEPQTEPQLKKPFFAKTACYYGCLLVRPHDVLQFDRPEDPQSMDEVMKSLGVGTIDWPFKTECCGAGLTMSRTDLVNKLSGKIVADAAERGAEAIVVACPMCHANLDMRGQQALGKDGAAIPILYLSQALGMAIGLDDKQTGIGHHLTPVKPERLCAAAAATVAPASPATQPAPTIHPNPSNEN
jgi:heterodisulfide reductase subunit B